MRRGPYERAGPSSDPAPSKVVPLTDTPNGLKAITVAEALVERLAERGCQPERIHSDAVSGWRAGCPFDDPTTVGSCGYLTIRETENGEALVAAMCRHTLSEVICDLMGVYPDERGVWNRRKAR